MGQKRLRRFVCVACILILEFLDELRFDACHHPSSDFLRDLLLCDERRYRLFCLGLELQYPVPSKGFLRLGLELCIDFVRLHEQVDRGRGIAGGNAVFCLREDEV